MVYTTHLWSYCSWSTIGFIKLCAMINHIISWNIHMIISMLFPNLNSWWIFQYSLSPHHLVFPWNFPCDLSDLPKFRWSDAAQPRSPSSVERLEQLPGVGTGSAGGGSCSSADQALRRCLRASRASRASRALGLGATPWRWVKMRWDIRVLRGFQGFCCRKFGETSWNI